jgi:guanylate kinase
LSINDGIPCLMPSSGLLVVVSGPSAVGKDTVLEALLASPTTGFPVEKCVTATTRAPRVSIDGRVERDGVDYHFVSAGRFNEMVGRDEFLEYAEVHDHWYGTPRQWVDARCAAGVDVILKIDVQGGLTVKHKHPEAVLIFLNPPSLEELERRLVSRGTDTEDQVALRLLNARKELAQSPHYDYAITNDSVPATVETIRAILTAEHCRIQRMATDHEA